MRDRLAIGVDIGGTKIAFALVTERGEVLAQHRLPSAPSEGAEAIFDRVAEGVQWLLKDASQPVAGVGVGCPGHLNPVTGVVYAASNLGWLNVPLKDGIARRLPPDIPLYVRKDGDAECLGELYFGAASRQDDFVYLAVGTGLGGGAVVRGEIVGGAHFNPMEVGHIPLHRDGRRCVCGMRGCPEIYLAGVGLLAAAREWLPTHPESSLAALPEISTGVILEAARVGDPLALRIMDDACRAFTEVILCCIGFFDPMCIVVGGGLGHAAPDFYVSRVRAEIHRRHSGLPRPEIPIVESQVLSSAVGAACLVWHGLSQKHWEKTMATGLLIKNAKVITPRGTWDHGWLLTDGQKIRGMAHGDAPDFNGVDEVDGQGLTLIPGFIDVHVHGGVGHETMDASPQGLLGLAQFYAQHGVTSFLPTTWTEPTARIMSALEVILETQGPQPNGATILGAHLEGPFISVEKRGAQREQDVRRAGREEALAYLDLNVIRLLSLAPEFEENHWLIRECVARGITVSVAHTTATYAQMVRAAELGITHATHTYNAMTGLGHREPGTLGAVLTQDNVSCELIADNIHVHPAAMKLLYLAKGPKKVILITDSVRSAGLPEGEYYIDDRKIFVKDNAVRLADGTLAGSTLSMDRGLRNFMTATSAPLEVVWETSSLNAARSIHVSDRKGSLEVGKDADLVLVDDQINVYMTVAEGRIVYRSAAPNN